MALDTYVYVNEGSDDKARPLSSVVASAQIRETGSAVVRSIPDAFAAKSARGHTAVSDANYQCLVTDVHVGLIALTASRTIALPDVDSYPVGQDLLVGDEAGACSDTVTITVLPGSGTGDTIPQTSSNAIVLNYPWQTVRLRRGASNVWLIV